MGKKGSVNVVFRQEKKGYCVHTGREGSVSVIFTQEKKDCCVQIDGKKRKC
jgi:hypothetical protein